MRRNYIAALGGFVLLLAGTLPALAQIEDSIYFTTTFPFYAENTKLPAGPYWLKTTDIENTFLIESTDATHSAFLQFIPTQSEQPHKHTYVTFHTYGDVEYLNRVWIEGQDVGMKVELTKAEEKVAAATAFREHSISAMKH